MYDPVVAAEETQDFLAQLGVTETLRAVMVRTAREFDEQGRWVSFDTLAYEAAEANATSGINEVHKLPGVLGGAWSGETVSLTALGLLLVASTSHTAQTLARLAELCAQRKMQLRDSAKVGQQILVSEHGFREADARRSVELVQLVPGLTGGGNLGDGWLLDINRQALDYRNVRTPTDLLQVLKRRAEADRKAHEQALAVAPAFAPGGMFAPGFIQATPPDTASVPEPSDPTAVFVVHGRDLEAKDAIWAFLKDLGLHPLDWDDDLVAHTGQGSPFIGQVLDTAFSRAQAVVVLMTPDDAVKLHGDLLQEGEQAFEMRLACQPRPNVLFEAGMAFGYCPSRTIIVEVGTLRPITDLGGRHTVRLGTEDTLRGLTRRLEVAGCRVDRSNDSWLNVARFADLKARTRRA